MTHIQKGYIIDEHCPIQGTLYEYNGKVSIHKKTGDFFILEQPEWDTESRIAIKVGIKLIQHWRKGEFPDITCWAG